MLVHEGVLVSVLKLTARAREVCTLPSSSGRWRDGDEMMRLSTSALHL